MKIWKHIRASIYLLLTVVVAVFTSTFASEIGLRWFIGSLICFYSLDPILTSCFKKKEMFKQVALYAGTIEFLLGLSILIFVKEFNIICIIWGLWSITRESIEIKDTIISFKENIVLSIISIIESLTAITFSIMLIFDPSVGHATVHMYLLIIEFITGPLLPPILSIFKYLRKK